ncbi:MAG: hypothetical protein IPK32_26205 [Verrucomicrobiaceae bacterium]|nr:hypothetical protein [Verrucomicrobiaceae bacterium]
MATPPFANARSAKGKDSPERIERGLLSDYVWEFVNRVAKEIGKTHLTRRC